MADPSTLGETEFRRKCRTFLEHFAFQPKPHDRERVLRLARRFQRAVFDAGLAGLTYPREYGGAGLPQRYETIWREEASKFDVPTGLSISHGMCLPTLNQFGTPEQKARHLAAIISGEELWCQLFSEPGAGSDVAGLQTRAVRDGRVWILNGQKVWTTYAHLCEYGMVLVRTNPDVAKHRGLSMFILDMRAPGVTVRPLRQITGRTDFNEVFLDNVRMADDMLVGTLNDGWRVATAMLMYERVSIGSAPASEVAHPRSDRLITEARRLGRNADLFVRQALAGLYAREVIAGIGAARTRAVIRAGREPGPSGSTGKLAAGQIATLYREALFQIRGPLGMAWDGDDGAVYVEEALQTMSAGIAGGTNEIQRNIIGERVLGLPREPALDREVPFRDLVVNRLSAYGT
jgi:alkylation response protein AidB-like acyl-CoA dehydrogenase